MKFLTPSPILAAALLCATIPARANEIVIVSENFGGLQANNLNSTTSDTFAAGITSAGGSSTWLARGTDFRANGAVIGSDSGTDRSGSAYLNLGSYINDAKGTASGKFVLSATVSTTAGGWLSLGFAAENSPNTDRNFTNTSGGTGTTTGIANMVVRLNGDIDQWAGPTNTNPVSADDTIIGTSNQTLTITLDFTPTGGYNGTDNFGTVIFNVAGAGSPYPTSAFTFTSNPTIGSILLGWAGSGANATGSYANLTLTQINPAADTPPVLTITPATAPATGYDLQWDSVSGKAYNLRTSTNLAGPIGGWDLVQGNITATPPFNVVNVPVDGPRRFYAIEEFDAP
jgi:hypothetical protein